MKASRLRDLVPGLDVAHGIGQRLAGVGQSLMPRVRRNDDEVPRLHSVVSRARERPACVLLITVDRQLAESALPAVTDAARQVSVLLS